MLDLGVGVAGGVTDRVLDAGTFVLLGIFA